MCHTRFLADIIDQTCQAIHNIVIMINMIYLNFFFEKDEVNIIGFTQKIIKSYKIK